MPRKSIANFPITLGSYQSFIEQINNLAAQHISSYVCIANVHMLIEAHKNRDFQQYIQNADLITPDGMPLTWGLSFLHRIKQERVAGMDLLPDLLQLFASTGKSVFFYGGTDAMLDKTAQLLHKRHPGLKIAGKYSPPYRALSEAETQQVIHTINNANPDVVFVALGCPKQERWMAQMKDKVNACMIGVGGALTVMIGLQKRAPLWMQKNGLEWFYRFCQEPKRLLKRYAVTNSLFIYIMFREYVRKTFFSNENQ